MRNKDGHVFEFSRLWVIRIPFQSQLSSGFGWSCHCAFTLWSCKGFFGYCDMLDSSCLNGLGALLVFGIGAGMEFLGLWSCIVNPYMACNWSTDCCMLDPWFPTLELVQNNLLVTSSLIGFANEIWWQVLTYNAMLWVICQHKNARVEVVVAMLPCDSSADPRRQKGKGEEFTHHAAS